MMTSRAILSDALADRLKAIAGQSYRPSNGTEGEFFDAAWCDRCLHDAAFRKDDSKPGCLILAFATGWSIGDPEYPKEWVYGEDGQPVCTAFTECKPVESRDNAPSRCGRTLDMFGGA